MKLLAVAAPFAAAHGSVWVANYASATLSRIDPATSRVTGT